MKLNIGLTDTTDEICKTSNDGGSEDVEMGKCMENLGVTAGDSRLNISTMRYSMYNSVS